MGRLACVAWLAGCGPEPVEDRTYLLLTLEARTTGTLVVDGGRLAEPILPRVVDAFGGAILDTPGGREVVEPRPGHLARVGVAGEIEWLALGRDVDVDVLEVDGPEDAYRELAEACGAEVSIEDGSVARLRAPDLVDEAAAVREPEALVEVSVVERMRAARSADSFLSEVPLGIRLPGSVGSAVVVSGEKSLRPDATLLPALVGVWVGGGRLLVLDAQGGFELAEDACDAVGRSGAYRLGGDRVLLEDRGESVALERSGETLVDGAGTVFRPLGGGS